MALLSPLVFVFVFAATPVETPTPPPRSIDGNITLYAGVGPNEREPHVGWYGLGLGAFFHLTPRFGFGVSGSYTSTVGSCTLIVPRVGDDPCEHAQWIRLGAEGRWSFVRTTNFDASLRGEFGPLIVLPGAPHTESGFFGGGGARIDYITDSLFLVGLELSSGVAKVESGVNPYALLTFAVGFRALL